jgi:hypothetical protein
MNENILQLPGLMNKLSNKQEQLFQKAHRIKDIVQIQNDKFEQLWKGYHVLGFLDNFDKNGVSPITRETFNTEFTKLAKELDELLNNSNLQSRKSEFRDIVEKQIVTILGLLNVRWGSIVEFIKLWSNRRNDIHKGELNLQSEYEKLVKEKNIEIFIQKTEKLTYKQIELIEKQIELIDAEDELYSEMEFIYKVRENLYPLSTELFAL